MILDVYIIIGEINSLDVYIDTMTTLLNQSSKVKELRLN